MFCTNEPCENKAVPESGDLELCRTCDKAWQRSVARQPRFHHWSRTAILAKTYHIRDDLLIRLPKPFDGRLHSNRSLCLNGRGLGDWPPENTLPFNNLFEALPPNRIACGFLELGEWLGNGYEAEFQISLLLGPDGKVWAEICDVEDLPTLGERDRETLAVQMVDEFLEVCDEGEADSLDGATTRAALHTWPVSRVMHWLQLPNTLRRADPMQRRLITGLLGELRALGFQPKP